MQQLKKKYEHEKPYNSHTYTLDYNCTFLHAMQAVLEGSIVKSPSGNFFCVSESSDQPYIRMFDYIDFSQGAWKAWGKFSMQPVIHPMDFLKSWDVYIRISVIEDAEIHNRIYEPTTYHRDPEYSQLTQHDEEFNNEL